LRRLLIFTPNVGIETVIVAPEVRPRPGRVVEVVEVKREGGGTQRVVVGAEAGSSEDDDVVLIKDEPMDD
jgi:DEAD/DEAH box helicase domain-containing protein